MTTTETPLRRVSSGKPRNRETTTLWWKPAGFDAGSYTLTVSHSTIVDDHGNDIDDATVAAVAVDVEGVIDYEGDSDYFRFTAEEGQTLPDRRGPGLFARLGT